ncbi:MAG: type II toxin-antitoxin system Phd/YefM family antitoxin [Candidatus Contendobacter sp.]
MISIAEARNQLPALIHQAETGQPVTISRRGKPVAVVLSVAEYERLVTGMQPIMPDGWTQLLEIRRKLAETDAFADWSDEAIRSWRDPSPGRAVELP